MGEEALPRREGDASGQPPQPTGGSLASSSRAPEDAAHARHPAATPAAPAAPPPAGGGGIMHMAIFERLIERFVAPSESESAAAIQLQSHVRGQRDRRISRERSAERLRLSGVTGVYNRPRL